MAHVDDALSAEFVTSDLSTGALTNADSLSTAVIRRNGTALIGTDIAVVNKGTGLYVVSVTLASGDGWVVGDYGQIEVSWAMGAVGRAKAFNFAVVVKQTGDNYARLGGPAGASIAADIAAIPTNPMLATEDGSSFTAIPDMATATALAAVITALGNGTVVLHPDYDPAKNAASQTSVNGLPRVTHSGTAIAGGTSTSIRLDADAGSVNNKYVGQVILLTGGEGKGSFGLCTGYSSITRDLYVAKAWTTTASPDSSTTYQIVPAGVAVHAMLTDVLTGTAISPTAVTKIQAGLATATSVSAIPAAVEAAILDEGDATALLAAIAAKVEEFLVNEGDATATIAAIAAACNSAIVAGTVGSNVTAIKAKTDQLVFTIPNQIDANALSGAGGLDASGIRAAIGLDEANLDIQLEVLPTLNELNSRTRGAF
jgi:hypothetical protein